MSYMVVKSLFSLLMLLHKGYQVNISVLLHVSEERLSVSILDPVYLLSSERDHAQATVQAHLIHDQMVGDLTFRQFLYNLYLTFLKNTMAVFSESSKSTVN